MRAYTFTCLNGNDVVTAKTSDHHPVIDHNLLFWNVMMQCAERKNGGGYNNGFKMTEDDQQYMARLTKVAHVIAEIVYRHPNIQVIGLCEGPVQPLHVQTLFASLQRFPWMRRLLGKDGFHKPAFSSGNNWGLLMLADRRYQLKSVDNEDMIRSMNLFDKLANRFQIWELAGKNSNQYFALAHLPFSGDELKTSASTLSDHGKKYCYLVSTILHSYSTKSMAFCADFNINPFLIKPGCHLDKIPVANSILSEEKSADKIEVTVDGILLSDYEKQRKYARMPAPGLFAQLARELALGQETGRRPIPQLTL